ncbi:NAD(P)H-binding protein [Marinomonas ostreistagni]|uniref:NAD(P)H-binding protein n=1 Tax=Marinomonas ostreistagni TaxID=359209 RepID=UPI001950C13C|nr:NAD(P)H-binding protein [Marinomonas ostreistagni]MBM6549523.1 NAD(P)H-binding protein [Marinomonas ostreistagni]
MSNVFIVGATGGVGKRLSPMLVASGHKVTGLCRDQKHADWYAQNQVERVDGDIAKMSVAELTEALEGHDTVVFSAGASGAGKEVTDAVDGDGPLKLIEAMKQQGIDRFYLVSAIPEAGRTKGLGDGFEHYMQVKKNTDAAVVQSDVDWVILRPGTLQDEEGDGAVSLAKALPYGPVKRGNVAKVLSTLIDTPEVKREIVELTDGDIPVDEAVNTLAKG